MSDPYVPAVVPPDPARDARVAARRAADSRRAGAALDRLVADNPTRVAAGLAYHDGWRDGYAACDLHHNRHYARPCPTCGAATERGGGCQDCAAAHRERQP